jgi:anti-sigma-K factor RskA
MMTTQSGDGRAHLHLLTGAYAADALSDPEREEFEQHLAGCADCTQEVRELRATGARLAGAVAEAPPPGLRDRVLAEIATVRQDPPVVDELERRRRSTRRWSSRLLGVAAAILLVVSLSLSALTITLDRRLDQLEADTDDVAAVLAAPDAQALPARPGGEGSALVVLSRSRGKAVFVASGLAATGADRTYQLWLLGPGSQPRSAGLLALKPDGRATQLLDGDTAGANGVALTVERAGGAPAPTTEPVVVVDLA